MRADSRFGILKKSLRQCKKEKISGHRRSKMALARTQEHHVTSGEKKREVEKNEEFYKDLKASGGI